MSLNLRPATSSHSLLSEARAVAATWAKTACNLASSRHQFALEFGSLSDLASSRNLSAAR